MEQILEQHYQAISNGDIETLKKMYAEHRYLNNYMLQRAVYEEQIPIIWSLWGQGIKTDEATAKTMARSKNPKIYNLIFENEIPNPDDILREAIISGNLELAKKLISRVNCKFLEEECMSCAVISGKMEMINWVYENSRFKVLKTQTFQHGISTRNIEILEWLRNHGCPYDKSKFNHNFINSYNNVLKEWVRNLPDTYDSVSTEHINKKQRLF